MNSLTVFGTIEFGKSQIGDTVSSSYIGGNAVAASLAAAKYIPVDLMGVIGSDMDLLKLHHILGTAISLDNVEQYEGNTFQYTAIYDNKSFDVKDHRIDFGVYGKYDPQVKSDRIKKTANVFFSGSNPKYSLEMLSQLDGPERIGVSTMLYHLEHNYDYATQLLKKATYIFTNKKEYAFLRNTIPDIFHFAEKLVAIFITDGKTGVTILSRKGEQYFPFEKSVTPIDPTNAGDVFAGTIMGMIVKGFSLEEHLNEILMAAHQEAMKVIINDPYYRKAYENN